MKTIILYVCLMCCMGLAAQDKWLIDNTNSNLNFLAQWRQNSFRTGEFKIFSGTIQTLQPGFENSKIDFTAEATSIDMIASNLSKYIQSEELLNTSKFPQVTFQSISVKKKKKNIYELKGTLVILGISRTEEFILEDHGIITYADKKYLLIKVIGEIERSNYNIFGGGEELGNIIKIEGYFEAVKVE